MYDINILPPNLRKKRRKKVKIKIGNPTYAPFLLAGVLASMFFLNIQLDSKIKSVQNQKDTIIQSLETLEPDLLEVTNHVNEIEDYKHKLEVESNFGYGTGYGKVPIDLMLDDISGITPPEVVILNITDETDSDNQEENEFKIQAETQTLTNMARIKESMSSSPYFENVELISFNQEKTNLISRPANITFTITFSYNPDATPEDNSDIKEIEELGRGEVE